MITPKATTDQFIICVNDQDFVGVDPIKAPRLVYIDMDDVVSPTPATVMHMTIVLAGDYS